jgi:hypothetical protein
VIGAMRLQHRVWRSTSAFHCILLTISLTFTFFLVFSILLLWSVFVCIDRALLALRYFVEDITYLFTTRMYQSHERVHERAWVIFKRIPTESQFFSPCPIRTSTCWEQASPRPLA